MENKKTYEGVLAEVWKPGKVAKIIVKASEGEIEQLENEINKEVKIIISDQASN